MEFCEKIKYVREKLSLSQEDLARELGVSFASVHRWENAKVKPIRMARAAFDAFCEQKGIKFNEEGSQL